MSDVDLVTLDDIQAAYDVLKTYPSDQFHKTPLLSGAEHLFNINTSIKLHLKLENTQVTGSFKVRGVINQFRHVPSGYGTDEHQLVSMSAGNYGKAFAYMASKIGLKGTILMPDTAPDNREVLIKSYGIAVERLPTMNLMTGINRHCKEDGMLFLHSFDDVNLIAGHGTIGLEILEAIPEPDIILVSCGGGGLLAGTASAIKLSGHKNCRIYGVEPEGSCTMYESFKAGKPVGRPVHSVAAGLSPPFAGAICYKQCKQYVDDILLVLDSEILASVMTLYNAGLVVEPSGAAAFAALQHGKVPDVNDKTVVVVITGGNMSPEELLQYSKDAASGCSCN